MSKFEIQKGASATIRKKVMPSSVPIVASQFRGGCITRLDRQLIPNGGFSTLRNFRWLHPGFETRKGQTRQHSTAGAGVVRNIYQFRKQNGEKHFLRQLTDGTLEEATTNPPLTTVGSFGSQSLPSLAGTRSASFTTVLDRCLFSDGERLKIFSGTSSDPLAFVVYKGTTAISRIPVEGEDFKKEVTDGNTATVAILDALSTLASNHAVFIMSPVKANALTFTLPNVNTNASVLTLKYWNGVFTTVAATDGTISAGASMGQSGTVSWTPQSDEIPSYMFGESGFWYQLSFSAALSATVRVKEVTYNSFWQDVVNVWDGVLNNAIEGQIFDNSTTNYKTFGSNSIDLSRLQTADYGYFSTIDPIEGFLLQVGATPNIVTAAFTGSTDVTFVDGGTGDDTIKCPQNKFLTSGFEAGMSITISGTVSNNFTAKIISVSSNTITVPTATTVAESNKSATITFNVSPATLNLVETWTGAGWTSVGATLTDATAGATKDGFVSWNRNAVNPSKLQFNSTGYYAYWYRFKFDKELSAKVNIGIQVIPYFDLTELGEPTQVATWKGRAVYSFKKLPFVYFSHQDEPMFLNGNDFGLIEVGDGRNNEVLCSKTFHNEMIVWQEERGVEGGCTTLIEGFSPVTFGRLVLSNRVGILNTKCAAVVEGVSINTSGQEAIKTIAFWLSREGIMATDGTTVFNLSYEINNFFDPTKPECIRLGYEDKHWLEYDSTYRVLRVGLVSGSTATEPNIFLVFDVIEKAWGFDVISQSLTCMTEIEAASGNVAVLQAAGSSDTFVYQANVGTLDNTDPIVPEAVMELDGGGRKLKLLGEYLRVKAQTTGNIVRTLDINAINTFTGNTTTLALQPLQAGEQYRRHRFRENVLGDHLSLKWTTDGVAPTDNVVLHDLGLEVYAFETGR